jgi:acyl-CoA reductase-like NAD-dependent aldehyde dehydrogenase
VLVSERHPHGPVVGAKQLDIDLATALLVGTTNEHAVNREEVFGPVASVIRAAGPVR